MTDHLRLQLSARLDGDASDDGTALDLLLTAVEHNSHLRAAWERYVLIGHLLRQDPLNLDARSLATRISVQIADEPRPGEYAASADAGRPFKSWRLFSPRLKNPPKRGWRNAGRPDAVTRPAWRPVAAPALGWVAAAGIAAVAAVIAPLLTMPGVDGDVAASADPAALEGQRRAEAQAIAAQSTAAASPVPPTTMPTAKTIAAAGVGSDAPGEQQGLPTASSTISPDQDRAVDRWSVGEPGVASRLNELLVSHRERAAATGLNGLIPYATVVGYTHAR